MTDDQIRDAIAAHDDLTFLATLFAEARGETLASQIAVAWSIRNRVDTDIHMDGKPDWWGEGYAAVCLARWQYSAWWEISLNRTATYVFAEHLLTAAVTDDLTVQLNWVCEGVKRGWLADPTLGSTHYCTVEQYAQDQRWVASTAQPRAPWSKGRRPVGVIGNHFFFAGVE